jgi:RNA polymerase sigma-70 factor (ECF subfamily)
VRRIAAGQDREAFALLFSHFAPRIKTFMIRAGMPAATAEELAQETMLTVWRKAAVFDPRVAAASTWIFTIARNLRIDHLRRARDRVTGGDIAAGGAAGGAAGAAGAAEEADTAPDGEAVLFASERDSILRGALETLSREQAQVLQLSFFGDMPHGEIAARLGIPLGTVKSRLRLGLGRLRHALGDRL